MISNKSVLFHEWTWSFTPGLCYPNIRQGNLHYFHSGHPWIIPARGTDFAGVVSNVTWPRLANDETAIFLNGDSGAAGWIDDHGIFLPSVPDGHSTTVYFVKHDEITWEMCWNYMVNNLRWVDFNSLSSPAVRAWLARELWVLKSTHLEFVKFDKKNCEKGCNPSL